MKIFKYILGLLIITGLTFCSDDKIIDEEVYHPWEPTELLSISVEGVEDGVLNLYTGATFDVKLKYNPETPTDLDKHSFAYSSNDAEVFTVDDNGKITIVAEKESDAILTVTSKQDEDIQYACAIVVTIQKFAIEEIVVNTSAINALSITVGTIVELSEYVSVKPDNVTKPVDFVYTIVNSDDKVASITGAGAFTALIPGVSTVKVTATNEVNTLSKEFDVTVAEIEVPDEWFDRTGWTVKASHDAPIDGDKGTYEGSHIFMLDDDVNTYASFVKPGKNYGSNPKVTVGSGETVFFVIDMQKSQNFNMMYWRHRSDNKLPRLRLWKADLYGSNTGGDDDFTLLNEDIDLLPSIIEANIDLGKAHTYRYVKVVFKEYDTKDGSTIGINEFNLGYVEK